MSETEKIRLNKFLSEAGICSRRAADREIEAGNVQINGRTAVPGDRVGEADAVFYKGKPVRGKDRPVLLAFHKPKGIVCTSDPREKDNIIDFIHYPVRIYTAGRLDKDSEGLILLTNQGDLVNKMMRAGNFHEKEYLVTVDRKITENFLKKMSGGVYLEELGVTTRPCRIRRETDRTFCIVLTQGLNRQIRRMCEALGCHVTRLIRVRIMNITLDGLEKGAYRELTAEEEQELRRLIRDSYSAPPGSNRQKQEIKRSRSRKMGRA